jgi:hypothetical protein
MSYEGYNNLTATPDKFEFKFVSEGPAGKIVKMIQFTETENKGIYNLAFGNLGADGKLNDDVISNNRDRNKILATVATAIYEFCTHKPKALIFFCGNTPQRTRLYRMALTINLTELKKDFWIYGLIKNGEMLKKINFCKGIDYYGFLIKRKKRNFNSWKKLKN